MNSVGEQREQESTVWSFLGNCTENCNSPVKSYEQS